jgi:hypothetical protein
MSLGIAVKGPEGIVLAADSRVTLFGQFQNPLMPQQMLLPASFDNATKLLKVKSQSHIAAVTYGAGAIGLQQPRTAHSFLPEFERELGPRQGRLSVPDFAQRLSAFFMGQWRAAGMPMQLRPGDQDMVFLVGGYDEDAAYGRIFEIHIPIASAPSEKMPVDQFGAVWGGQRNITDRILQGFDAAAPEIIFDLLDVPAAARTPDLETQMRTRLGLKIPIQFLPLQDCVDLAIFLIRATTLLQKWVVDVRGVGGAVDVATITRTDGFNPVQLKRIMGENPL